MYFNARHLREIALKQKTNTTKAFVFNLLQFLFVVPTGIEPISTV